MSNKYYESYNYSGVIHRDNRHTPIENEDDWISSKNQKKKKKHKRSNHKHKYIPAIYNFYFTKLNGKKEKAYSFGSHCKVCGRINDMTLGRSYMEDRLNKFKKQYPNYVEINLPENWEYFKDKYIPV